MIKIVCWKWDGGIHKKKNIRFSAHHVNVLESMVRRNVTVPYEFICITDNPMGISPTVKIIPLWQDFRQMGGCYTRLKAFSKEMKELIGDRFIWLDLDCVITGNIDHLLNDPADFKMWGDTNPTTPYNGSMCLMNAGCRAKVWEEFDPKKTPYNANHRKRYIGTDQACIAEILGPNEQKWTQRDGVYSFRVHIKKHNLIALPENAKIVFFHGQFDPSHIEVQSQYPWVKEHWSK